MYEKDNFGSTCFGGIYRLPRETSACNSRNKRGYQSRVSRNLAGPTIYVQLPAEVKKITTRDTISSLETSLVRSVAMWSDGFLHHSLANKSDGFSVQVVYRDIVHFRDSVRNVFISEPYSVPAKFTNWQSFFIKLGRITLFFAIGVLFSLGLMRFRLR